MRRVAILGNGSIRCYWRPAAFLFWLLTPRQRQVMSLPAYHRPRLQSPLPPRPLPSQQCRQPWDFNEIRITGIGNETTPWTILVLLTFSSLDSIPVALCHALRQVLVVFHFLRQALGLQRQPIQTLMDWRSCSLSFSCSRGSGPHHLQTSIVPMQAASRAMQAVERGAGPLRRFSTLPYVSSKKSAHIS